MSVIARTAQLLDILRDAGSPVTLTELSRAAGLPLTTVHRLCSELIAEGMIERAGAQGLRIGLRLWEYGRGYARAEAYRVAATRYLRDLHEVSRATVELAQLIDDELLVTERITAQRAAELVPAERVERLPFEASAPGLAVLAAAPPAFVEARRAAAGAERWRRVEPELRAARAGGLVRRDGDRAMPFAVLAAAVRGRDGAVAGAVSLQLPAGTATGAYGPSVIVTARRIGKALG